jgi:hypothetical protein
MHPPRTTDKHETMLSGEFTAALGGGLLAGVQEGMSVGEQGRAQVQAVWSLPFNLNEEVQADATWAARVIGPVSVPVNSPALVEADGRLNREDNGGAASRVQGRGLLKFVVPLRKSLLCNPPAKQKVSNQKKSVPATAAAQAARKNVNMMVKGLQGLPVEGKATNLLLSAAGLPTGDGDTIASSLLMFGEQFVNPLQAELAGSMRVTLGLPMDADGGADCLDALVANANEA